MKRYRLKKYRQTISAAGMLLAGILVIISTDSYIPKECPPLETVAPEPMEPPETEAAETIKPLEETESAPVETEPETSLVPESVEPDSVDRLNMAYRYPSDSDLGNADQSIAGRAFIALSGRDADWISGIYGFAGLLPVELAGQMGKNLSSVSGYYNPEDETHREDSPGTWIINSWSKVNITFYNGEGQPISGYSNAKEILSMASVYAYWKEIEDQETFLKYTENLWAASHRYIVQMSDVYYCEGELHSDETETGSVAEAAAETETGAAAAAAEPENGTETAAEPESEAEPGSAAVPDSEIHPDEPAEPGLLEQYKPEDIPEGWETIQGPERDLWEAVVRAYQDAGQIPASAKEVVCPGHIDLNISAYIDGLTEEQGLFVRDITGSRETSLDEKWHGWDQTNRAYARALEELDWYAEYGLSVSTSMYVRNPLSPAEIAYYMNMLPDGISKERKLVIRQALRSVGCIPYYWGGKPSAAGFEGNRFGTRVTPDEDGRILRGLDCSGWINWVYWTALGSRLPYESTSRLIQCGTAINREELQPGDIIVKTGESSHVYLFLAWSDDDHMYVIHETSGTVNNVTINRYNVDWPYYRKLISE